MFRQLLHAEALFVAVRCAYIYIEFESLQGLKQLPFHEQWSLDIFGPDDAAALIR